MLPWKRPEKVLRVPLLSEADPSLVEIKFKLDSNADSVNKNERYFLRSMADSTDTTSSTQEQTNTAPANAKSNSNGIPSTSSDQSKYLHPNTKHSTELGSYHHVKTDTFVRTSAGGSSDQLTTTEKLAGGAGDTVGSTGPTRPTTQDLETTERYVPLSGQPSLHSNNIIDELRRRASQKGKSRIDSSSLFNSTPRLKNLCIDNTVATASMLHASLLVMSIILFILSEYGHQPAHYLLGALAMVSNIFGLIHSMYNGGVIAKLESLNLVLQKFAEIFSQFARALDIQEEYLENTKKLLNFFDDTVTKAIDVFREEFNDTQTQQPMPIGRQGSTTPSKERMNALLDNLQMSDPGEEDEKETTGADGIAGGGRVSKLVPLHRRSSEIELEFWRFIDVLERDLCYQLSRHHISWLNSLFDQYRLLDNRLGITEPEYLQFIKKLPKRCQKCFQALRGVDQRFKVLTDPISGETLRVLLYEDMEALVTKVVKDLRQVMEQFEEIKTADNIQKAPFTMRNVKTDEPYMLARRLSQQFGSERQLNEVLEMHSSAKSLDDSALLDMAMGDILPKEHSIIEPKPDTETRL